MFPCIKSTGLSSEEFCERLIYSERVAVVPGTAFGECGEGFDPGQLFLLSKASYRSSGSDEAICRLAAE